MRRALPLIATITILIGAARCGGSSPAWIEPAAPTSSSGGTLLNLVLAPRSVTGGGPAAGTVTLGAPASVATTVTLASNPPVAVVPASLTVPAGATSTPFNVTTTAVAADTQVTLTSPPHGGGGASPARCLQ
jgi:hypothetical protein